MKFCTECQNMYYIKISNDEKTDGNQLNYYCRFCGHEDEEITQDGVVVLKTQFKKNEQKFNHRCQSLSRIPGL